MAEQAGGITAPEPPRPAGPVPEPKPDTPDTPADGVDGGVHGGVDDTDAGPQADEAGDPVQSAAQLGESASTRRRLRQAGQQILGGAWFDDAADFAGPASFGSGHAVGGNYSRAGRDVNFIFGAAAQRPGTEAGPISPGLLARIRETHVPGSSDAETEQALHATRIVLLRGARGAGRRTSALWLLTKLAGDNVHELGASEVFRPPDNVELQEGAGYLAEGGAGSVFAYHQLAAWPARLRGLRRDAIHRHRTGGRGTCRGTHCHRVSRS